MSIKKEQRGGARPGAGRTKKAAPTKAYTVRLTVEEHDAVKLAGGLSKIVRGAINGIF